MKNWKGERVMSDTSIGINKRRKTERGVSSELRLGQGRSIAVMEVSQSQSNNPNQNPLASSVPVWPTIDGPLGVSEEESVKYARRFYKFGFALLPLLWAVNCFYFWPVLRHSHSFPRIRPCLFSLPFPFLLHFFYLIIISSFTAFLEICCKIKYFYIII